MAWAGVLPAVLAAQDPAERETAPPPPGFTREIDAALERAADEDLDLLLYFSGSDWSQDCRRLREDVFESGGFAAVDDPTLLCVQVDFPRDPTLQTDAERQGCRRLQERYRATRYPTVYLADPQGRACARIDELAFLGPKSFLKAVAEARTVRTRRDAAWNQGGDVEPAERSVAALAEGLRCIEPGLWRHYRPELEAIVSAAEAGEDPGLAPFREALRGLRAEDEVPALMEEVQKLFGQGRVGDAVARIDGFVEERGEVLGAGVRQSLLYSKAGLCARVADLDGAIGALDSALAIDPRSALAEQMQVLRGRLDAMRKR